MGRALAQLKVSVPSVAARDFAYTMLPTMAIPAIWLMTPATTQMLANDYPTLDDWLAGTAAAIERAENQQ